MSDEQGPCATAQRIIDSGITVAEARVMMEAVIAHVCPQCYDLPPTGALYCVKCGHPLAQIRETARMMYTIDVELPEARQGNPPLATTEQQQQVITEVLPLFNPPEMDTILRLLQEGKLTTEYMINGADVSFVLRPIE